jgi:hypothetical protein
VPFAPSNDDDTPFATSSLHLMQFKDVEHSSGAIQKKIISLGLPEKESLEDAERAMEFSKHSGLGSV